LLKVGIFISEVDADVVSRIYVHTYFINIYLSHGKCQDFRLRLVE